MRVSIDYIKKVGYKRKIQIHKTDLCCGPSNLAAILYPFLIKFKKLERGVPIEFCENPFEDVSPENCDRPEEWHTIVDKIIYAMYWTKEASDPEEKEYFKAYDRILRQHKKELSKLSDKNEQAGPNLTSYRSSPRAKREDELLKDLQERYFKNLDEHEKKVQEGLELFGKYFRKFCD